MIPCDTAKITMTSITTISLHTCYSISKALKFRASGLLTIPLKSSQSTTLAWLLEVEARLQWFKVNRRYDGEIGTKDN